MTACSVLPLFLFERPRGRGVFCGPMYGKNEKTKSRTRACAHHSDVLSAPRPDNSTPLNNENMYGTPYFLFQVFNNLSN